MGNVRLLKEQKKPMNTYRVEVGRFPGAADEVLIVRANNCAEADKKAEEWEKARAEANANKVYSKSHVIKIEELSCTFIE
jgi:hypothetical protein